MKSLDKKPISTTNRVCPFLCEFIDYPGVFTSDECKQIINTALNDWEKSESFMEPSEVSEKTLDLTYRNTTIYSSPETDNWLLNKTVSAITECNNSENGYQFLVSGILEYPHMLKYESADINKNKIPGQYKWHMDIGIGSVEARRKLSYIVFLNSGEYEGGELCFHTGNSDQPQKPEKGSMIIFPSYLVHQVMPVTKGIRYTLVGWLHGNSFI